ncbi:phosphate ABC transporter substrate-binding protein PstS [Streptomyces sp. E11-3]|uniref:phosphate ABC transporter substrate-binding protein PstS n=1 Tax=Streptomyces sp. E11-3 TaxID=3110112 RepID=UPI003980AC23
MRHRHKRRSYLLPAAAGTAVAAAAVGGVLLFSLDGRGGSEGRDDAPRSAPAAARIDCEESGKVAGSGSTAQQNAVKRWIKEYQRACPGVRIAYRPLGSGAGVAQFLRGATAFGGTDGALKPEDVEWSKRVCPGGRAIDLPMVGGPVAIGYNLADVDDLVLDAPTLAKIYDSEITRWDDPAIRKLNPGVELPGTEIQAVHRSDGSGTTENLNAYLSQAAPQQWPYPVEKAWKGKGGHSADGSDGVVSAVRSTPGALGYFELSFAEAAKIPTVRIDTGAAEPVEASPQTASVGIAAAEVVGKGKDLTLKLDYGTSADGAYPIVLVAYEIVCDTGNDAEALPALRSFLSYTAGEEGQKLLPGIHYAPLPEKVAVQVREVIRTLS